MGKVSPYLIQPLNPFFRYFAQHLAEQITRFPFALIIAFSFLFLIRKYMDTKFRYFTLIDSIYFLILLDSIFNSVNSCMSMFLDRESIIDRKIVIYSNFISLRSFSTSSFISPYVKSWIYLTPFPYLIDFPANLLSGNETNISGGLSMQILWIFYFSHYLRKSG